MIRYFEMMKVFYPHRADYNVFLNEKDLFAALYAFFIEKKREGLVSRRLLRKLLTKMMEMRGSGILRPLKNF